MEASDTCNPVPSSVQMGHPNDRDRSPPAIPQVEPVAVLGETQKLVDQACKAMESDTIMENGMNYAHPTSFNNENNIKPTQSSPVLPATAKGERLEKSPILEKLSGPSDTERQNNTISTIPLLKSIPEPLRGDLVIVLHETDSSYNCRVDKERLSRLSVKLNDVLANAAQTYTSGSLAYGLILRDVDGELPQLVAQPIADIVQTCLTQHTSAEVLTPQVQVKKEPDLESNLEPGEHHRKRRQSMYAQAYRAMLVVMHGPRHDFDISEPMSLTLEKVETISEVSSYYDVLPLARNYLREMLHEHGSNAVLIAIRNDPPRWLQLSIRLQNFQWYKEAVIHVIGAYHCPMPGWSPYTDMKLPQKVTDLIKAKSEDLQRRAEKLTSDLLLSTLNNKEGYRVTYEGDYENWIALQKWQYWLAGELRKIRIYSEGKYLMLPSEVGKLLRAIQKGGRACFDIDEDIIKLREVDRSHRWNDYTDNMKELMVYASRTVMYSGLTRSNLDLQLDGRKMPLGGEHMVDYLVCAEVTKADVPWR